MALGNTVRIIIAGDAKQALGAFAEVEAGAEGMGAKLAGVGKMTALAFVGIAAAEVAAGAALFKIGESFDEAYDKIRVGTGATGEVLAGLKEQFKQVVSDVPTDFGKAADALTQVTARLGAEGPIATTLTEQFLELSRITKTDLTANIQGASQALLNWNIPVTEQTSKLDMLFRTSQLTGVSFADLASQLGDSGTVLRTVGFSFDQSAALLSSLSRAGIDAGDVMPALSKAMATAAKEGKSASTVFAETFAAIKNAPDGVVAAGEALTVFGAKAGPRLASMIREGRLDYEGLMAAINNGSDTILGAGKETLDFAEKWELLKNRVLVALEPVAMKVFDGVGKAMDKLGPVIVRLSAWFSENLPIALRKVQGFIDVWGPRITAVLAVIVDYVQENWPKMAATITQVMAVITKAVEVGVAVIQEIWDRGGKSITAVVVAAFEYVKRIIEDVMKVIQGILDVVMGVITGDWSRAWKGIHDALSAVWDAMAATVTAALALIAGIISLAWEGIKAAIPVAWDGIRAAVEGAWSLIADAVRSGVDNVVSFVAGMPGQIASAAVGMWDSLLSGFKDVVNAIIGIWNGINFTLPSIDTPVGTIGGNTITAPQIPYIPTALSNTGGTRRAQVFGLGGMVDGPLGLPQLALVHGGERVLTPEQQKQQSGGFVVNQTITHPDVFALAEAAARGVRRVALLRR